MGFYDLLPSMLMGLLTLLVPGFFLALPFTKKLKLGLPEALGFGFCIGLVLSPFMLLMESFVGLLFSYELFIANTVLLTIIGVYLCIREKVFPLSFEKDLMKNWYWILLLLFILTAFYVRMQSAFPSNAGTYFYEFDPYFYTRGTQFIIEQGAIPRIDDLAWYPYVTSHRAPPLSNYLGAEWYSIINNNKPFDLYTLGLANSFYPPVVAAATVFLAFMLISEPYGKKFGLVCAGLVAFAPRIVEKLAAWEQEQTPWGVFGAFFFYAAYVMMIKRQDRSLAVLTGIALAGLSLGSKSDVQAYLVMAGFLGIQGLIDYSKNRLTWKTVELNAIVLGFALFAQFIISQVFASFAYFPNDPLALMGAMYFYYALWAISDKLAQKRQWTIYETVLLLPIVAVESTKLLDMQSDKWNYVAVLLVLGVILLFSPVGAPIMGYVQGAIKQAVPNDPLANTVAEEGGVGNEFVNAMGPAGAPFKWMFENGLFSSSLAPIVFAIPALIALALAWRYDSKYALYFAIVVLPVAWVGLGKIKFVLQLSAALIIGISAVMGGLVPFMRNFLKDEERLHLYENALFAFGMLVVLLTAWAPLHVIALSADSANYADAGNGQMVMDCNKVQPAIRSMLFELPYSNKDVALNMAYYLYCSKIPQWWLDPMTWIRENVDPKDRVIHWWDYGHWTNYFGQRKTVTRNDHPHLNQDMEMADLLVSNTPAHAAIWMRQHEAKYLLVDQDLINKWGALVYLSCVQNNETAFVPRQVGSSQCEAEHYFERVFVPAAPTEADLCNINAGFPLIRAPSTHRQTGYCVGQYTDSNTGQSQIVMAYESNGTQVRGILWQQGQTTLQDGRAYNSFLVIYPPAGQGYEDRVGKAYDSVFYQAFFLGHVDGFEQVFPYKADPGPFGPVAPVRIFKLKDDVAADVKPLPPVDPYTNE